MFQTEKNDSGTATTHILREREGYNRCKADQQTQKSILPVGRKKILYETIRIHSHAFIFGYQFIYSFVLIFFLIFIFSFFQNE